MTDFSKTKFNCSSIGNLMSSGRGGIKYQTTSDLKEMLEEEQVKFAAIKNKETQTAQKSYAKIVSLEAALTTKADTEPLSEGLKGVLKNIYGWEKYKRYPTIQDEAKLQFSKGIESEDDTIRLLSALDGEEYKKCEEKFENEYLIGKPDIIKKSGNKINYVIEAKTSWDMRTFTDIIGTDLLSNYWWQIQGYFALTGADVGEVSYCLVSTPYDLINKQIQHFKDKGYEVSEQEIINSLRFDDIPPKERRIKYQVERDDDAIERIYIRLQRCREYLTEIEKIHCK
jgi:hypothetical protein